MSIIIFIIVLVVLILVHEIGHFIAAKRAGIKVLEFGIGFPPKIFSKKVGETKYSLNWIPFGGFVKIFGEDPSKESISGTESHRSFVNKPKRIQALVIVAGVAFNMLLAVILFSAGFFIGMPVSDNDPLVVNKGYEITNAKLTIVNILQGTPAENADLKAGDEILSVATRNDNVDILNPENVSDFIASNEGEDIAFVYKRAGEVLLAEIVPESSVVEGESERVAIGMFIGTVGTLKLPILIALIEGTKLTVSMTYIIAIALGGFLLNMFTLSADLSQIAGPVGIVGLVGDAAKLGFVSLLNFTAIISIHLALINSFPFPALDGGRLVIILIEAIKKSPIKPKIVNAVNTIGFALLILLMLVVTYNDILKLF
ncbi:MAG: site-2 protease family protein [Candidatus Pacebacteria bacterium]|jgi:regulator of sigma E protease|nr:site-2 protease family protein [Candidatus Paceibacterota bacterium]|tara:strand:+ start:41111 stop:42223 length:1113 start_codon:yes stop_codon:yes gene_type:complete